MLIRKVCYSFEDPNDDVLVIETGILRSKHITIGKSKPLVHSVQVIFSHKSCSAIWRRFRIIRDCLESIWNKTLNFSFCRSHKKNSKYYNSSLLWSGKKRWFIKETKWWAQNCRNYVKEIRALYGCFGIFLFRDLKKKIDERGWSINISVLRWPSMKLSILFAVT